jgi:cytochrome c-type biogenesis protein CcmF
MEPLHLQDGYTSDGFMGETLYRIKRNASFSLENLAFELTDIFLVMDPDEKRKLGLQEGDIVVKAVIRADNTETPAGPEIIEPLFVVRDSTTVIFQDVYSAELDTRVRIAELSQEENTLVLGIRQREFVVMQALIFPGMNVLWTGCIMMILGCAISLRKYFATSPKRKPSFAPAYNPPAIDTGPGDIAK